MTEEIVHYGTGSHIMCTEWTDSYTLYRSRVTCQKCLKGLADQKPKASPPTVTASNNE